MNSDLYRKLVDLYAGDELTEELASEMEVAASHDLELKKDMTSLRGTVQSLKATSTPDFTEESYQRVLLKLYARGVELQTQSPTPAHLQYHLPIQG